MAVANDNAEAPDRFSVQNRQAAIRLCEAMAAEPDSRRYLTAPWVVADIMCLVLEAIGLTQMPPTGDQWALAARALAAGWSPGRQITVR